MTGLQRLSRARALVALFLGYFLFAGLLAAGALAQPISPAHQTTFAVVVSGVLPGFDSDEAPKFLAAQMAKVKTRDWSFVPNAASDQSPPDRIEWQLTSEPYAGGGVRQFIPIPSLRRLFGAHRMLSVEAQLYRDGKLQSQASGRAAVLGGADDADLAALIAKVTADLEAGQHTDQSTDVKSGEKVSPTAQPSH